MKNVICKALERVSILRCRNVQLCKMSAYRIFQSLFFFSILVTHVLLFNLTHVFCKVQLEQIFSRIWKCRSSACCEIKSFEEKGITISLSLILYWRAACDILTASQIQKESQTRPSRKNCAKVFFCSGQATLTALVATHLFRYMLSLQVNMLW